ncbi:MAG: cysteine rich repeat-containing protein [Leptonema sp. (in: bacteria)]
MLFKNSHTKTKIKFSFLVIGGIFFGFLSLNVLEAKAQCKEDREKFCKDIKPGEGRIFECLVNHFDQLSTDCKTKIEKKKKEWDAFKNSCSSDIEKFCPNTPIGKGKIRACLAKNKDQISEQCKNYLIDKKDQKKKKKDEFKKISELEEFLKKEE